MSDVGWVKAGDLQVGQELVTSDGRVATVTGTRVQEHSEGIAVYNFTVDGDHTYFVTDVADDQAVWVHNNQIPDPPLPPSPERCMKNLGSWANIPRPSTDGFWAASAGRPLSEAEKQDWADYKLLLQYKNDPKIYKDGKGNWPTSIFGSRVTIAEKELELRERLGLFGEEEQSAADAARTADRRAAAFDGLAALAGAIPGGGGRGSLLEEYELLNRDLQRAAVTENPQMPRTWASSDTHVPELANALEQQRPGSIKFVNLEVKQFPKYPSTVELDIVHEKVVVQVKSGGAQDIIGQINRSKLVVIGRPVVGYAPDPEVSSKMLQEASRQGIIIFTKLSDLLDWVAKQ